MTSRPATYLRPRVEPLTTLAPLDNDGAFLYSTDVTTPRRDSLRRRSLALADALSLIGAYALLWILAPPPGGFVEDLVLLPVIPGWILLNKILRLYDRDAARIHQSTLNEVPSIVHSLTLGTALVFLLAPPITGLDVHREQILVFLACAIVLAPALRYTARTLVRRRFEPERVLLIGSGQVANLVAAKLSGHPEYGACLIGYVDVEGDPGSGGLVGDIARLGDVSEFEEVCREHEIERVVIAFSSLAHEGLLDLIRMSKRLRLKVSVVPRLFEVIGHGVEIDQIEGMTLLGLPSLSLSWSTLVVKRTLDVVGSAVGLLLCAPLFLVAAVAIKLDSNGSVLYRQRRIGRHDREFAMWKLRTMVADADNLKPDLAHLNEMSDGPMFKITDDPRVTRVGRLLRRTSIDELPQLWNVLRGDMSLVGPRPLVPSEDNHVIGWHRSRLELTPGLTGPWQVFGRNSIPFHEMVKLDYLYVAEWSLWNDIKLILRTIPVVLRSRGA